MNKTKLKRLTAFLLAAVMLFSFAACSKGGDGSENGSDKKTSALENKTNGLEKEKLEHVYSAKELNFSSDNKFDGSIITNGTDLWSMEYYDESKENEDGTYDSKYGVKLYKLDIENGKAELFGQYENTNNYNDAEKFSDYTSYGNFTPTKDGNIWLVKTVSHDDWSDPDNYVWESKSYIIKTDAQGNELASIDTSSFANADQGFYVNSLSPSEEGGLYIISDMIAIAVDASGNVQKKLELSNSGSNSWVDSYVYTGNGKFFATKYTYNEKDYTSTRTGMEIDMKAGTVKDLGEMDGNDYGGFIGVADGKMISTGTSGLYTVDPSTMEKTEILNWLNSDFNPSRMGSVTVMDDGSFIVGEYDTKWEKQTFYRLTKVSDSDIVEKYTIKLGGVYLGDEVMDAVIRFNKQNTDFRIKFVDYSVYNNEENEWNGGTTQLNNDIIAGNIPDIIMMDNLQYSVYASKGLLSDLGSYMDMDESFDRSLYLENILNASAYRGKIYSLFPSFAIQTIASKKSIVGDLPETWTMDDMQRIIKEHPDAEVFSEMAREDVLRMLSGAAMAEFTDPENGTCTFDSDEFIKLLEIIKTFPEEINWDELYGEMTEEDWEEYNNRFKNGKVLFNTRYLSDFYSLRNDNSTFGDDVCYIGFPGKANTVIVPNYEVAISSKSPLQGACWDFIKYLFSEEYQTKIGYSYPIMTSVLEDLAKKTIEDTEKEYQDYQSGNGGMIAREYAVDTAVAYPEDDINMKPVTQEQVDKIMSIIRSAGYISRDNEAILAIISEEAASFFTGTKDARTVAGIIQSRAQIYMQENM